MAEQNANYMELLKSPITVFSILVALIIGKYALGISFGPVSEVGPGGVKFAQEANAKLAELEGKLNGVSVELESLRKRTPFMPAAQKRQLEDNVFAASQQISDQTAQLASIGLFKQTSGENPKGFVWIGNYKGKWERVLLGSPQSGQPLTLSPDQLQPGTEYVALGNMVVRQGLPENSQDYYRGRAVIGTISRGSKIRLISKPTAIDREFAVQYWVEIETVK